MIIRRKYLFLLIYALTLACLLLSTADFVPMVGILAKTKYLYILFCVYDFAYHRGRFHNFDRLVAFVFIVYLLFSLIFGVFIRNPIVIEETQYQFRTTLLMLLLLLITYYEIGLYNCFNDFVLFSYISMSFVLCLCGVTHIWEMSFNPLYVLKIMFNSDARSRSTFGLGHWNYIGFLCFVDIISSIWLLLCGERRWTLQKNLKVVCVILGVDLFVYLELVSASTRSAILSLCVFILSYILIRIFFSFSFSSRFFIGVVLIILMVIVGTICSETGLFSTIWESSRSMNIEINMPIFRQYGNIWTGMGWVENGALQPGVDAFGLGTSSLDIYYVYCYFTTGIIGCIFMGICYLTIGYGILKRYLCKDFYFYLALFISLLFMMIWDTVLFTIKLWSGIPLLMFIFYGMTKRQIRDR